MMLGSGSRARRRTLFFFALFFAAFYGLQVVNGRFWMHDFEVYYRASRAFLAGEPVYGPAFGLSTGHYKYAPCFLLFVAPVAALPFFVARTVHFALTAVGLVVVLFMLERTWRGHRPGPARSTDHGAILLAFLIAAVHVYREMHLGNINVLLLLTVALALDTVASGRGLRGGGLLGAAVLVKPHLAPLLPLLAVFRSWGALAAATVALAAGLIAPALLVGFAKNLELHKEWVVMVRAHNAAMTEGPNTLYAWVVRLSGGRVTGGPGLVVAVAAAVSLTFLALLLVLARTRGRASSEARARLRAHDFRLAAFVFLAAVPLLTLTDTEHFLFALPLIMLVLVHLRGGRRGNRRLLLVAVPAFLMYGGNWHDLLGHAASRALDRSGILGLADLLIILLAVHVAIRLRGEAQAAEAETP